MNSTPQGAKQSRTKVPEWVNSISLEEGATYQTNQDLDLLSLDRITRQADAANSLIRSRVVDVPPHLMHSAFRIDSSSSPQSERSQSRSPSCSRSSHRGKSPIKRKRVSFVSSTNVSPSPSSSSDGLSFATSFFDPPIVQTREGMSTTVVRPGTYHVRPNCKFENNGADGQASYLRGL